MNIAQLKTKITAADIYLRGAVVSRHGRACLKQGRNVVYIDGCSSSMENDSICLRFAGNVTARSTCVRSIREIKDDGISSGRGSGLKQGLDIQKMIKQMKGGKGSKKRRKNKMLPGLGGMPMGGGNGMPF